MTESLSKTGAVRPLPGRYACVRQSLHQALEAGASPALEALERSTGERLPLVDVEQALAAKYRSAGSLEARTFLALVQGEDDTANRLLSHLAHQRQAGLRLIQDETASPPQYDAADNGRPE